MKETTPKKKGETSSTYNSDLEVSKKPKADIAEGYELRISFQDDFPTLITYYQYNYVLGDFKA